MIVTALLAVVMLAFAILSLGIAIWVWITLRWALDRNAWRTTPGVVTDSRVVANRNANGLPGHHYRVGYEFEIGGEDYRSTLVRLGDFRYFTRRRAERMAAKYPVGAAVTVHYDAAFEPVPSDREPVALLEPGFNPECFYPIAVLCTTLGITALCAVALVRTLSSSPGS